MNNKTISVNLPIPDTNSYITISGLTKEGIEILLAALYEQKRLREAKQEGMLSMDKLADYGKKLNNYVLKNEGDIFELKKLADELNRDFYADVVELKATFCQ